MKSLSLGGLVFLVSLAFLQSVPTVSASENAFNVVATKVVCDHEADLPNWGTGPTNTITANTVTRWINVHPRCHVQKDWKFQWSYRGVGNPGDNAGAATDGWHNFPLTGNGGTTSVSITNESDSQEIWFREVMQDGYVPFTYGENSDNSNAVSAEFYCNDDVLNYDNWEWINTEPGKTYYCVAWNVLAHPGTVTVEKFNDVNGNGVKDEGEEALFGWEMNLSDVTQTTGEDGRTTFSSLASKTYDLSETEQVGWKQTGMYCDNAEQDGNGESNSLSVSVGVGETVFCHIGNTQVRGTITIKKVMDNRARNDQRFTFVPSYGSDFQLGINESNVSGLLVPGTYTVTEQEVRGWRILDITCADPDQHSVVAVDGSEVTIELKAGGNVVCTFINRDTKNPDNGGGSGGDNNGGGINNPEGQGSGSSVTGGISGESNEGGGNVAGAETASEALGGVLGASTGECINGIPLWVMVVLIMLYILIFNVRYVFLNAFITRFMLLIQVGSTIAALVAWYFLDVCRQYVWVPYIILALGALFIFLFRREQKETS